jgi:preprotein translocase subunit SecG
MTTIVLIIHLMIAVALVGLVLVQRSEGGALGIGGGGGGFMTGRGAANLLTRMTAVLAAAFFVTSIVLTMLARTGSTPQSILDGSAPGTEQTGGDGAALPKLTPLAPKAPAPGPSGPQVPQSQ